jgi:dephospho-CoA kinase
MRSRPPLIGVTGDVASGKSFVAQRLGECGATVIDVDRLGHEVLRLPDVETAARQRWGDEIFSTSGQIDRRRLAERVFAPTLQGQEELRYLESLTHPRIRKILDIRLAELAGRQDVPAMVIDVPLLVESGWNEFCDKVVFVEAPRAVRLARSLGRGWSEEDFARREARQQPSEVKRQLANVVIDNGGSQESTHAQTDRAWKMLSCPIPAG